MSVKTFNTLVPRGAHGSGTGGYGFRNLLTGTEPNRTCDFFTIFHGSEPPVFCGSGLVSRFSTVFHGYDSEPWFRHGFGSKFFEP